MVRRSSFLVTAATMTALMGHAGEMPDFSLLDLDDDGLINEDEYVSYSANAGTASEAEAKAKFTKFDLNSNGTVSEEELADALAAWRGQSDYSAATEAGLPAR
ncbi:MAG: EF-hand domain-containing protein [Hyphomonas sp.]|nr:EF-hand domain-containing protein [Hyphomonas sp.]